MIKAGIIGGSGYTAGELLRLLIRHPDVHLEFVCSESNSGKEIAEIHPDLIGESDLSFSGIINWDVDVIFLCKGHGFSRKMIAGKSFPENLKIIDLSQDFRLERHTHNFTYGLPELNREKIQSSNCIANCGCFATAIQLALLPLAQAGLLDHEINIHAITGSSGAGQEPVPTTHFSWRNNNVSAYKIFNHQHLGEIYESLKQLQPAFSTTLNFIPIRGGFSRGIFASLFTKMEKDILWLKDLYTEFYQSHPFVWLSPNNPDLKQVINTNKCLLYLEKHNDQVVIISLLDNLMKGASGQAVQNMNLMFGFPEPAGLLTKAVAF